MEAAYASLLLLFLIPLLLLQLVSPLQAASPVCTGTQQSELTIKSSTQMVRKLRERLDGCKYVLGNVEIHRLDEEEFEREGKELDLSFLNSIVEIVGCLYFNGVCTKQPLRLQNLIVIKGRECKKASFYFLEKENCKYASQPVLLPSLRYIGSSHAIIDSVDNCFLERHVNFKELFNDPRSQLLKRMPQNSSCGQHLSVDNSTCHSQCPVWPTDGKRHCWGPGPNDCQVRSKCSSPTKCSGRRCFINSLGEEQCCASECLAGCYGITASQCHGCVKFDRNGTCSDSCNIRTYDRDKAEFFESTRLYMHGPLCVSNCPEGFYMHGSACLGKCPPQYSANEHRKCVKVEKMVRCTDEGTSSSLICDKNNSLLRGLKNDSLLCTEYHGVITISNPCFLMNHPSFHKLNVSDLYKIFSRLKILLGSIEISADSLSNASFFAPLERIMFSPAHKDSGSLVILSKSLYFLGTRSLKHVAGKMILYKAFSKTNISVYVCKQLLPKRKAYEDGIINYKEDGLKLITPESDIAKLKAIDKCSNPSLTCHELCNSSYGCWGPEPESCVRCSGSLANDKCVVNCESVDGFFYDGRRNKDGTPVCSRCHSLCRRCTGPTAQQCSKCTDEGYYENGACVKNCTASMYYVGSGRICRRCSAVCLNLLNGMPTCTGPNSIVGPGGCQFCSRIRLVPRSPNNTELVIDCIGAQGSCPTAHFPAVMDDSIRKKLPSIYSSSQMSHYSVSVCQPCDKTCLECQSSSTNCKQCRYNTIVGASNSRLKCTETPECPYSYYSPGNRTCLKCDPACKTCSKAGNNSCLRCADNAFALRNNSTFNGTITCVSKCPRLYPTKKYDSRYGVECVAALQGETNFKSITLARPEIALIAIIIVGSIAVLCAVFIFWACQRKSHGKRQNISMDEMDEDQELLDGSELPAAANLCSLLTISENELIKGHEIGSGAFGTVYKGEWTPANEPRKIPVAIKILTDSGDSCSMSNELLEESRIMASVVHENCVKLVGVCMTQPLQLITKFMPLGNLRDFLRARKGTNQIGSSHLLRYAAQIASGMNYLEKKNIIHRDLACRNVLVESTKSVKITDFGLAKLMERPSAEYQASGGKLPVKWLALECLTNRRFSHKSDVWAYGVTLWEIFSFGEPPYQNVKPVDLADYLEKGERLKQPEICTLDVYMIMIKCWMLNEQMRPTFDEMESSFRKMANDPGRYVYIKGDRFARSASRNSASSSSGRGSTSDSKSASLANSNADQEGNYVSLDNTTEAADNDVFEHDANTTPASYSTSAGMAGSLAPGMGGSCSTLPIRSQQLQHQQQQQQQHWHPRHSSTSGNPARTRQDNKYTPLPPPPVPHQSSHQQQLHRGRLSPALEASDDYLQPISAGEAYKNRSGSSGKFSQSPTISNPEYFFNSVSSSSDHNQPQQQRQLKPPIAPPPRTSSIASSGAGSVGVKKSPTFNGSDRSRSGSPVWMANVGSATSVSSPASAHGSVNKLTFTKV